MIRWPLLPLSLIYWIITSIRNLFYDWKIFPSTSFPIPLISVGNLSVGGTGKSPQCIYLVDILKDIKKVGVLSRGYGRMTVGYKIANYESNFKTIGDEPMQMFLRFKNKIIIAVSENRVQGVKKMLKEFSPEIIILDDAFQHRSIKPGFSIILSEYNNLYINDYLLPAGNLRESCIGIYRADVIIITKTPENTSMVDKQNLINSLHLEKKIPVFFSKIVYDNQIISRSFRIDIQELIDYSVLLVTGIAEDNNILKFVTNNVKHLEHISYKDHYQYTENDIQEIQQKYNTLVGDKLILTTEKDYTRLMSFESISKHLFYLPIDIEIDDKESFNSLIINYATKNTRNS